MTEPAPEPVFDGQTFQLVITGDAEVIRGDDTNETKE